MINNCHKLATSSLCLGDLEWLMADIY